MAEQKTFRSLMILKESQIAAMEQLGAKYDEAVNGFIKTIQMVMNANNENHFEAMKRIQDKTELSDSPENKIMFAAALYEITEVVNLNFR